LLDAFQAFPRGRSVRRKEDGAVLLRFEEVDSGARIPEVAAAGVGDSDELPAAGLELHFCDQAGGSLVFKGHGLDVVVDKIADTKRMVYLQVSVNEGLAWLHPEGPAGTRLMAARDLSSGGA
jgi:hypothetical protein